MATSVQPTLIEAGELRRGDADDREGRAIERHRLADDVRRAAEAPLPETIADDHDRAVLAASAHVVRLGEGAAENRRHAQHLEETAARHDAVGVVRLAAARQVEAGRAIGEGPVEQLGIARAQLLPQRVGPGRPLLAGQQLDEMLGLLDRQGAQHQRVDDREDRRVGADAERQGEDGDRRDHRRRPQRTNRIADVRHGVLDAEWV